MIKTDSNIVAVPGKRLNYTKIAAGIISVLVYLIISHLPHPAGLMPLGQDALALMIATIILWVFEVLPIAITSALIFILLYVLGIQKPAEAMGNFMTTFIVFIMATMIIGVAFTNTGVGKRVSLKVSSLFGTKSSRVLLGFMLPTAIVSSVLTDIATALIFAGVAYPLLQKNNCTPGKSNFGRAMMMGIAIASAIGGISTPAGSGLNVQVISLMKSTAHVDVNFLQWTEIAFPMAIVLTFIAWYIIVKMVPPEFDEVKGLENVAQESRELGRLTIKEKKFVVIFGITIVLWFTQPWTQIDSTFVAIACAGAFFLPGINLLTWDDVKGKIGWDMLFLLGTANALAMAMFNLKAAAWIANTLLGNLTGASILVLLLAISAFGVFSHLIVPVAGATVAVTVPVLSVLATKIGVNPAILIIPVALTASCVFLIPIDPIPLTTFQYKYWRFPDMMKVGVVIGIIWVIVNALFMYAAHTIGLL